MKKSWQQLLKDEIEYYKRHSADLRNTITLLESKVKILEQYSKQNPDIIETCGRFASSAGEALHSMSNFIDKVVRMEGR